jgi:hypothetical protein
VSLFHAASAAFATECPALPGADALLRPGARIHIGELHGTVEIPRAFATLVCHAAKTGPTRVGLELPVAESAALAAYLRSAGTPADRHALVAGDFWSGPMQDGRRSEAYVAVIETLRALRHGGADVDLVAFDSHPGGDRDRAMAEQVVAAIARAPEAIWLLFSGNVHARKTAGPSNAHPMAACLVERGVALTTLDARYGRGSAWVCVNDCGPNVAGRAGAPRPLGITMQPSADGAYDGVVEVGAIHFSPPAGRAPTADEAARAAALPRVLAALAAYDAGEWTRSAPLFESLARELRSADHAYNAACCHALAGHADRAFAALGTAVDYGLHDAGGLTSDSDLVALRGDPRWTALLARVRAPLLAE